MTQALCQACNHPQTMHYDGRGCHVQNCTCTESWSIAAIKKSSMNYSPQPIVSRSIPEGSSYIKELWAEIQHWHGDLKLREE